MCLPQKLKAEAMQRLCTASSIAKFPWASWTAASRIQPEPEAPRPHASEEVRLYFRTWCSKCFGVAAPSTPTEGLWFGVSTKALVGPLERLWAESLN